MLQLAHVLILIPGLAQGMITGMRGLCNGLGPAFFGLIFYFFHVDLNAEMEESKNHAHRVPGAGANLTSPAVDHQLASHVSKT